MREKGTLLHSISYVDRYADRHKQEESALSHYCLHLHSLVACTCKQSLLAPSLYKDTVEMHAWMLNLPLQCKVMPLLLA